MEMLSTALIKEKALFLIIHYTLEWGKRAGSNYSFSSEHAYPIDWFGAERLQKDSMSLFNVWQKYVDFAEANGLAEFKKIDDVSELIKDIKTSEVLDEIMGIPENLFFSIWKKSGLKSKQMLALKLLYKE